MALSFNLWSRTAASNATADPNVNWSEGQLPSTLNDSGRGMMASLAAYRDDTSGTITTGGTATAYTVTSYQVFSSLALMANQVIAFVPHATNTNAVGVDVTLNVDGLGAKSIRMQPSVALPGGSLVLGTPYAAVYNNSDAVFYLKGISTNPYNIPLGGGMDFWGATVPNSSFAFPIGQAISRTTYATLFSIFSTTYGAGDTSTTFNLPDKTGRVSAMIEASATRLTSTHFVGDSTVRGAVGGGESKTLVGGNLPAYTPAGTITNGAITFPASVVTSVANGANLGITTGPSTTNASLTAVLVPSQASSSFTGTAQGGTSTAFRTVQPTITCNYIIRII